MFIIGVNGVPDKIYDNVVVCEFRHRFCIYRYMLCADSACCHVSSNQYIDKF